MILQSWWTPFFLLFFLQKESEKRNVTVQADDPISFMQLTAKNEMTSKEDQFQLSLLAAMGNTQRKEAADPLASKLNKVHIRFLLFIFICHILMIILHIMGKVICSADLWPLDGMVVQ